MKLGPVLHDLRRGILRIPVVTLLALFILGGVGITYLTYSFTAATMFQGILLAYFTIDPNARELRSVGILIDRSLEDVRGTLSYELTCTHTAGSEEWRIDGSASIEGNFTVETSLSYMPQWIGSESLCTMTLSLTTPYGRSDHRIIFNRGENNILWTMFGLGGSSAYLTDPEGKSVGGVSLASFKKDGNVEIYGILVNPSVFEASIYVKELTYFEPFVKESITPAEEELEKAGYRKVGVVGEGFFTLDFDLLNESARTLSIALLSKGEAGAAIGQLISSVSSPQAEFRQSIILSSMNSVFGLFSQLFPIVALYLVYIYIARPRAWGALEFVLARPISRFDLFFTRYAAGVLVLTTSTFLFAGVFQLSTHAIFSATLESYALGLILVGTALSLIAFYSLCYFLSTVVKGGTYLALSILSYLVFTLIASIVVAIVAFTVGGPTDVFTRYSRLTAMSWLLNPLGASDIAWFYIQKSYGIGLGHVQMIEVMEEVLHPWAVAASISSWIAIPVVAGWLKFRKENLSQ